VVAYLTTLGVPGDRLDAVGVGALPSRQTELVQIDVVTE
jgi:hypothetical protein